MSKDKLSCTKIWVFLDMSLLFKKRNCFQKCFSKGGCHVRIDFMCFIHVSKSIMSHVFFNLIVIMLAFHDFCLCFIEKWEKQEQIESFRVKEASQYKFFSKASN